MTEAGAFLWLRGAASRPCFLNQGEHLDLALVPGRKPGPRPAAGQSSGPSLPLVFAFAHPFEDREACFLGVGG